MLGHLGEAARLMGAVERVTEAGLLTPDLGGKAARREGMDAVREALRDDKV